MSNKLMCVVLAAVTLTPAAGVMGATWTKVGDSGFIVDPTVVWDAPPNNPQKICNMMAQNKRIRFNSMVVDNDGNIFATVNNAENGVYQYAAGNSTPIWPGSGSKTGGVTIFKPDGSGGYTRLDVNVSNFDDGTTNNDKQLAGAITKLVVAGDGKVYGLMNWLEIQFENQRQRQRIIRINADGTVDAIWSPGRAKTYGTSWTDTVHRIRGMTVGGDGNIYIARNGADGTWTKRYLWRINVHTEPVTVEESPTKAATTPPASTDCPGPDNGPTGNQGWGASTRLTEIEYVGSAGGVDSFAILSLPSATTYRVDALGWDKINTNPLDDACLFTYAYTTPVPAGSVDLRRDWYSRRTATHGSKNPGWVDGQLTATAYDPGTTDRPPRLWVAPRGWQTSNTVGTGNSSEQPWSEPESGTNAVTRLTNLGGGNYGMVMYKATNTRCYFVRGHQISAGGYNADGVAAGSLTLAARFRVDAMSSDYTASYIMHAEADTTAAGAPTPLVGVRVRYVSDTAFDLELWDILSNVKVVTLGSNLVAGAGAPFYEIRLHVNATTGVVRTFLNGTEVVVDPPYTWATETPAGPNNGEVACGAATSRGSGPSGGTGTADASTATITFDWVLYTPGLYLSVDPGDAPSAQPIGSGGLLAAYLTGNVLPAFWVRSNNMIRYNGTVGQPLFSGTGSVYDPCPGLTDLDVNKPMPGIQSADAWHMNGNDPIASNRSNGGMYWVSALAINPCDGRAWMAWAGQQDNDGPTTNAGNGVGGGVYTATGGASALGKIWTMAADATGFNLADPQTDQGAPMATDTSQVIAIAFKGTKVYALAVDIGTFFGSDATGAVSVYQADNPACQPGACCKCNGTCEELTSLDCPTAVGEFQGVGTTCDELPAGYCAFRCCHTPFADADGDGDVDQIDFSVFQACITGTSGTISDDPVKCSCYDVSGGPTGGPDTHIEQADLTQFELCATGPDVQWVSTAECP